MALASQTAIQDRIEKELIEHDGGKFNEHEHLAAIYSGNTFAENWQHLTQKVDFYFVKEIGRASCRERV